MDEYERAVLNKAATRLKCRAVATKHPRTAYMRKILTADVQTSHYGSGSLGMQEPNSIYYRVSGRTAYVR